MVGACGVRNPIPAWRSFSFLTVRSIKYIFISSAVYCNSYPYPYLHVGSFHSTFFSCVTGKCETVPFSWKPALAFVIMWGIHATIKGTFLAFILELIVDFLFILIGIIFVILIAIFFLVTENLLLFVFKNVFASERLFSSALKRLFIISKSVLSNIVLLAVFTYPHYREFTDSQFISIALQIADKFHGTDKQDAAEGLLAEAF